MAGNTALQSSKINQRYNDDNINLSNTIERGAADAYNKQGVADREVEKGIFDGTSRSNANFNKERLGFRLGRRSNFVAAIDNRRKTEAMNQIDPDYAVDPSVVGLMHNTPNYRKPNANTGVSRQEMNDGYDYKKYNFFHFNIPRFKRFTTLLILFSRNCASPIFTLKMASMIGLAIKANRHRDMMFTMK